MGWGILSFICNFSDGFTATCEPTVHLRQTKCMRIVINANALGTHECTAVALKGNLACPVILP